MNPENCTYTIHIQVGIWGSVHYTKKYFSKIFKIQTYHHKIESHLKAFRLGVPIMAQCLTNPTSTHEDVGSIPGLTQWVKDPASPGAAV